MEPAMKKLCAVALLTFCTALPASGQTYRAEGRIDVTPVPGGFRVPNGGGMGARGMWCAAADYARRFAGARGVDRIYVAQNSSRGPVTFTLDPTGLTPSRFLVVGGSVRRAGNTLSVDHAIGFCADFKLRNR
jgi:hypothetical protein